jgi:hypothetical protein
MRTLLFAIASLAVAAPASADAQSAPGMQFSARSGSGHHGGFGKGGGFDRRDGRHDGRRDDRRHRGHGDDVVYYDGYREYQGDTAWRSDSFNDWWHDRPDRAYPRWVAANQNCERKWFAGDTLRC